MKSSINFLSACCIASILALGSFLVALPVAFAEPSIARPVHPGFKVPDRLRGRVDFWVDVFSKYGKAEIVIHHRRFPQIRFDVVDLRAELATLDDVSFDSLKERTVKARIQAIEEDLRYLGAGNSAHTPMQQKIVRIMSIIPGDKSKYLQAVSQEWVRSQTGIRDKMGEAIRRAGQYLPIMEKIFVEDFGLPLELTRLPFVESSFDYTANSSVGAAGIWQFMPKTARSFDMIVNNAIDERRDPVEASKAAARYFRQAYLRLGTWPLAVTSYNHGIGGVVKKVRDWGTPDISALIENNSDDPPFGFASANFYPELLAAIEVYNRRHELFPEVIQDPPMRFVSVQVSRALKAPQVVAALGASKSDLERANYGLSEMVWGGRIAIPMGYNLKVPAQFGARLARLNLGEGQAALPMAVIDQVTPDITKPPKTEANSTQTKIAFKPQPPTTYKVRPGETLHALAQRFGTTVEALSKANGLKSRNIHVGQELKLPLNAETTPKGKPTKAAKGKKGASSDTPLARLYKVRKGDTLSSLSKQFRVSVDQIKKLNKFKSSKLSVGSTIKLP